MVSMLLTCFAITSITIIVIVETTITNYKQEDNIFKHKEFYIDQLYVNWFNQALAEIAQKKYTAARQYIHPVPFANMTG